MIRAIVRFLYRHLLAAYYALLTCILGTVIWVAIWGPVLLVSGLSFDSLRESLSSDAPSALVSWIVLSWLIILITLIILNGLRNWRIPPEEWTLVPRLPTWFWWDPRIQSDDENTQWAWLRAIEWINWPIFVSQPIMPVILYFYPAAWARTILCLFVLNGAWYLIIPRRFESVRLADFGCVFVRLKWVTCPLIAFMFWKSSQPPLLIALALFWPIAVLFIQTITNVPLQMLFSSGNVGPVQKRFMLRLGYVEGQQSTVL